MSRANQTATTGIRIAGVTKAYKIGPRAVDDAETGETLEQVTPASATVS